MHKDINRDISRLQDYNLLLGNGDMTSEVHADTHPGAGICRARPKTHPLPARVRNWAKGPGKVGGMRMWWTGGLTREGRGCCPVRKDRGCRLNRRVSRLLLASTSRRGVQAPAGCSRQAGGREEKAQRKPEGRLAAGGSFKGSPEARVM